MSFIQRIMKRGVDIAGAAGGLVALSPVLVGTSVVVGAKLGKPVLFKQERPGYRGKPFMISKFRTMTDARDADGNLLPDAERLTRLGRFLRASSIDELPELLNVLRGEMSLVGPRPLRMSYLEHYSPEQARRHDVRPGITGWAQINGRNQLTWAEKFELDVWYVDNQSLWLDLKILATTVQKVLMKSDISHEGHATMFKFTGQTDESLKPAEEVSA